MYELKLTETNSTLILNYFSFSLSEIWSLITPYQCHWENYVQSKFYNISDL